MAHIRSPGGQLHVPLGFAGAAGAAAPPAGGLPPAGAFVVAPPPAGALPPPPAGALFPPPFDADAKADALVDRAALASAVGVGAALGVGAGVGATATVFSVTGAGGGSGEPFITTNAPMIAATATVAPTPINSGVLFFCGISIGAAIAAAGAGAVK